MKFAFLVGFAIGAWWRWNQSGRAKSAGKCRVIVSVEGGESRVDLSRLSSVTRRLTDLGGTMAGRPRGRRHEDMAGGRESAPTAEGSAPSVTDYTLDRLQQMGIQSDYGNDEGRMPPDPRITE